MSKKIISWELKLEVDYDDRTEAVLTGADMSEHLCQCIDDELTEIERNNE